MIENLISFFGLGSLFLYFITLIIIEVLYRPIFKKYYAEDKKLIFWNKINWMRDNKTLFNQKEAKRTEVIVKLRYIAVIMMIILFITYIVGNITN